MSGLDQLVLFDVPKLESVGGWIPLQVSTSGGLCADMSVVEVDYGC